MYIRKVITNRLSGIILPVMLSTLSFGVLAADVTVIQMDFYPPGANGVPSSTDSEVRGDNTSTPPNLTPAVIDIDLCTGALFSGPAGFFGFQWEAVPDTCFTDSGANTWDYTSVSGQGGGSYDWTMAPGQFAMGLLFDWGAPAATPCGKVSCDIPVLAVFNADGTPVDTDGDGSPGTPMGTPPFGGQTAAFTAGTPPIACQGTFSSTALDTPLEINIASDLLNTCSNVQGVVLLDSYTQPTNGTATDDGTTLTYTPNSGFNGLDSFTYTAKDDVNTATAASIDVQVGGDLQGNFTMLDSNGDVFGGTNDVVFTWDGSSTNIDETDTTFGLMEIRSDKPHEFFGFVWTAHHIRVFGPGTYSFDTGCTVAELENTGCKAGTGAAASPGETLTMTVGPGQFGAHILFDWNTSTNIDVVNVWDQNAVWDRHGQTGETNKLHLGPAGVTPAEDATWVLVSTDINGDDINGSPMVDGPFQGFYANFNNKPDQAGGDPEPFVNTQQDTTLGSGPLASLNVFGLIISLTILVGLRLISRREYLN